MSCFRPDAHHPLAIGLLAIASQLPAMALAASGAAIPGVVTPLAAVTATAATRSVVVPPVLPPGGSYTSLGDAMHIQGQPVFVWVFDAPGSLPDIADWLSARQQALQDLWVMPGAVVLAGVAEDGMHWVVRLSDAGTGRTQGTISAMQFGLQAKSEPVQKNAAIPGASHTGLAMSAGRRAEPSNAGWRLKGGQLHFEFCSKDENAEVIEQIWTHAAAPAALGRNVSVDLAGAGWRLADKTNADVAGAKSVNTEIVAGGTAGSDTATVRVWTRGRAMLSLIIAPLDQGSGVTAVLRIGT